MNNSSFFTQSKNSRPASKQHAPHSFANQVPKQYTEADFADFSDYYAVLEVEPNAERDAIKKNYRRLILDWHPDKRPESPTKEGSKMFTLINEAWEILKDSEKRVEYTKLWREYKRLKLMPFERAELSRKEGNEMYKKGQIAARDNNIPQALSFYQQAIERYSDGINMATNDHRLHSNRALCFAVLRDWPRAKKDAQKVVEIRPTFMKGWFTLVRAHIMEYNLNQAEADLAKGLAQCNNHQDLVKLREEIAVKRAQVEQANQPRYGDGSHPNSARNNPLTGSRRGGDGEGTNAHLNASKRDKSPRDRSPGGNSNIQNLLAHSNQTNITPSHTPPTPILGASGYHGHSYRSGRGGMQSMQRDVSPGWGVDLEQTNRGLGQTLTEHRMYDLDGTAAFGRSIGYSRTPPKDRSPRTGAPPPPPGMNMGMGHSSTRGFGNTGSGTPPRYNTPPRYYTPRGAEESSASNSYNARPWMEHTVDFGTPNPLNQSYGHQLNQSATQVMGYPPSMRRNKDSSRSPIQGRSPATTPPRPMRPPSLARQAESARPRLGGSASEPRLYMTGGHGGVMAQ